MDFFRSDSSRLIDVSINDIRCDEACIAVSKALSNLSSRSKIWSVTSLLSLRHDVAGFSACACGMG